MWLLFLALPVLVYLALLVAICAGQTALLFPTGAVPPSPPLPPGAERFELVAATGERLHGVHIPPATPPTGPRLLILGFGGNGWNAAAAALYLHDTYPQADIVAFHYRGYAPSGGRPHADAFREDSVLIHDFAVARLRPGRVVAIGFSIGSGVAAGLAAQRRLDGLVLVTPFDSLGAVAAGHYPWLPVRWLLRHRMEPAADLALSRAPVALIAAGDDTLIPAVRTEALQARAGNVVLARTIEGAGHNDIYDRPEFRAAMREALESTLAQSR